MTVTPSDGAGFSVGSARQTATPDAPAAPVLEPVRRRRSLRLRWAALAVAVAALLAVGGGLALANLLRSAEAQLARYAPSDATAYIELRLDLPGDQRQRVLEFASHFPGLEDEQAFDRKVAAAFDRMGREADHDINWARDVEPWFGGQVASFGTAGDAPDDDRWVVGISVRDRAAALAIIEGRAAAVGLTAGEYRGASLWQGRIDGERAAVALTDNALLVSESEADVRAAVDSHAGATPALADEPRFANAVAELSADRLATFYLDTESLQDVLGRYADDDWPGMSGAQPFAAGAGLTVGQLRAEGDHMAVTSRFSPSADSPPLPDNRDTGLAARTAADSFIYFETRDAGSNIRRALEPVLQELQASGEDEGFLLQMETFLGTSLDEFFDFLDDVAVSATRDGDSFSGGMVATVTDLDTAEERLQRLVGILRMAAGSGVAPLTVSQEEHGDVRVTVIRFDEEFGSEVQEPGMGLPSLSYAFDDGLLFLGTGNFVPDALDRAPAASLANTAAYANALGNGASGNAGVVYVDLAVVRELAEEYAPDARRSHRMERLMPYLEPLDRLVSVTLRDGDDLVNRTLLYVE